MPTKLGNLLLDLMEGWLLILAITKICLQYLAISLQKLWEDAYQFALEIEEIRLLLFVNFCMDVVKGCLPTHVGNYGTIRTISESASKLVLLFYRQEKGLTTNSH